MSGSFQLGDPFSAAAGDQTQPGALGQSPAFWQHLAMFGGNLAAAANARTGSGHLAYGSGFAGPFGAAIGETAQQTQRQAQSNAEIGRSRAETTGLGLRNQLQAAQMPAEIMRAQFQTQALQNPNLMSALGYGGDSAAAPYSTQSYSQTSQALPFEGGVHRNESGGSMAPGVKGDGGQASGPMQVHPAALQDVNSNFGTNLTPQQLTQYPELGKWAGDRYLELQQKKFGPVGGVAAYNAGPGRMQQAINGQAPLPASTAQYVQNATGGNPGDALMQQADALTARANRIAQAQNVSKLAGIPPGPGMAVDPAAMHTQASQIRATALQLNAAGPEERAKLLQQREFQPQITYGNETAKAAVETRTAQEIARQKELGTGTVKPQIDRFGNLYRNTPDGGVEYLGRGSEVKPVWNPETNNFEYGEVGGLGVGASGNLSKSVGGAPPQQGSGGQIVKPNPQQERFMEQRGHGLAKQFDETDEAAQAAKDSNYLFDNMRADAKTWDMDQFAPFEAKARSYLLAGAHLFGIKDADMPDISHPLADYTAFNKSSGQLLRAAVHDTSSRAAVQEYKLIGESLPHPTTSAEAFGQVADQWQGMNDFRLAKQKFMQSYTGAPEKFEVTFNSRVSPTAFMLNRMEQTPEGQQTAHRMFERMQQTPEGKLAVARMLQNYTYARKQNLFDTLQPDQPPGQ